MFPSLRIEITVAEIHLTYGKPDIEKSECSLTLCTNSLFYILFECFSQSRNTQNKMRTHLTYVHRNVLQCFQRSTSYLHCSDCSTSRHHDIESHHMSETVVKRQNYKRTPGFVNIDQSQSLFHISSVVSMSQHNTLWVSRSTAGICYSGIIIIVYRIGYSKELIHRSFLQEFIPHCHYILNAYLSFSIFFLLVEYYDILNERELSLYLTQFRQLIS